MSDDTDSVEDQTWDRISVFEGIFPIGSDLEGLILEKRRFFREHDPDKFIKIGLTSEMSDNGITSSRLPQPKNMNVQKELLGDYQFCLMLDLQTLIEIDRRVRWCRALLAENCSIESDQDIWPTNDPNDLRYFLIDDPEELKRGLKSRSILDSILSHGTLFHTPIWYAAKILSHFRRVETIWENRSPNTGNVFELDLFMSTAREWMLFGETWAEARSVVNFGQDALRGKKTIRAAKQGGEMRKQSVSPTTLKTLTEIQRLLTANANRSVTWAAQTAHKNGYGKSPDANRKLWYRNKSK